jgi:hypothetical protein
MLDNINKSLIRGLHNSFKANYGQALQEKHWYNRTQDMNRHDTKQNLTKKKAFMARH